MSTATVSEKIDAIAIGGFDGMHIGHQHLFSELGEQGAIVVIETGYANLTPGREREHFTEYPVVYYPLEEIRHLDGEGFVSLLAKAFPRLCKIVVGYDFHFGKDRMCTHEELRHLFSGEVVVVDQVCIHNDSVHSHKIRAKLGLGDVSGANAFLGHSYTVHGPLVRGQGLGKKELYPTVNIETSGFLLPREGVYVTLTRIDDDEHFHPSVSFVGHRVSTDGSFAVEAHILDGEVECKRKAAISFIRFIRENRRFGSIDALKKAIEEDIAMARKELAHLNL